MTEPRHPRVILITGASGNLGREVVKMFFSRGDRLILVSRHEDKLHTLASELGISTSQYLAYAIDLTSHAEVQTMFHSISEQWGRIDVLIHAAGGFKQGRVHETSLELWDWLIDVNARSLFYLARNVTPIMIKQKYGRIIHVASRSAYGAGPSVGVYAAAKAAVLRITEAMAVELAEFGITVNCLIPKTIDTPENRVAMPNAERIGWSSPFALAEIILLLASDAAGRISGAAIPC